MITSGVHAQKRIKSSKVAPIVMKDFNVKFPNASKVKWRKIESLYFASFMQDGKGIDVTYKSTGEWLETLSEISIKDLPAEVATGVNNLFTNAIIKAVAKVEQSSKETLYIVQLRFKGRKAEMTLDAKGNQVS